MPENIFITEDGEAEGFWQWIMECNISIIICEGVKKAAAFLTQGYVAIAIPGITSDYRVVKDEFGNVTHRQLTPDLEVIVTRKRSFYICLNFENLILKTKPRIWLMLTMQFLNLVVYFNNKIVLLKLSSYREWKKVLMSLLLLKVRLILRKSIVKV
jgi:hypothetical protein